jgi:hypothetical protein
VKRLVIDDERTLIGNPPATYARNVWDGGKLLSSEHWDQVFLDNDLGLGGEVYVLVDEIERMYITDGIVLDVDEFIIHTANPVARSRMVAVFKHLPYRIILVDSRLYFGD